VNVTVGDVNDPPVASFTFEPSNPSTAVLIYFNSTSSDADGIIVNWTWDFGDSSFAYGENVTHQYADDGSYTVNLTVRDDDDATDSVEQVVIVTELGHIYLQTNWNLISLPFNESKNKNDIIVAYGGTNYTWTDAVTANIIVGFVYGWNRTSQTYETYDILHPGDGYWIWAYYDCELIITGNVTDDGYITALKEKWNIMGLPYNTSLAKEDLIINYGGSDYTWEEATTGSDPIILGFIYGWDRITQTYILSDEFDPGYGYWMYAYYNCTLKK
jgi:PKD repeat protein